MDIYIALMAEYVFTREPNGTTKEVGPPHAIEMTVKECHEQLELLKGEKIPKDRHFAIKEYPHGHIRAIKRTCSFFGGYRG